VAGPVGRLADELVEDVPGWVDVVGSTVIEHLPSSTSAFGPRAHPAVAAPLARVIREPFCPRGHWKHQLFRVRTPGDVYPLNGWHTVGTGDGRLVREASASLLVHHVPIRDRARTTARLKLALAGRYATDVGHARLTWRLEMVEGLYEDRPETITNYFLPGQRLRGLDLRDWRELVGERERTLPDPGEDELLGTRGTEPVTSVS
jgi:hypothetical protein